MGEDLNEHGAPMYEACALTGEGVFDTLKGNFSNCACRF